MPTSFALSPHLEHFIREQVASGRFNNASEVVRAGLLLLEDQETSGKLEALRKAVAEGLASGPGVPVDEVLDRLEAKYSALDDDAAR